MGSGQSSVDYLILSAGVVMLAVMVGYYLISSAESVYQEIVGTGGGGSEVIAPSPPKCVSDGNLDVCCYAFVSTDRSAFRYIDAGEDFFTPAIVKPADSAALPWRVSFDAAYKVYPQVVHVHREYNSDVPSIVLLYVTNGKGATHDFLVDVNVFRGGTLVYNKEYSFYIEDYNSVFTGGAGSNIYRVSNSSALAVVEVLPYEPGDYDFTVNYRDVFWYHVSCTYSLRVP